MAWLWVKALRFIDSNEGDYILAGTHGVVIGRIGNRLAVVWDHYVYPREVQDSPSTGRLFYCDVSPGWVEVIATPAGPDGWIRGEWAVRIREVSSTEVLEVEEGWSDPKEAT